MSCNVTITFSGGQSRSLGFTQTAAMMAAMAAHQGYTVERLNINGQDQDIKDPLAATVFICPMSGLESAWVLIANAHGGNWSLASNDWRIAAERWRDEVWHKAVGLTKIPVNARELTDHRVNSLNESIRIQVLDGPGAGGACSRYLITGVQGPLDHHPIPTVEIKFQDGALNEVGANGLTNEALLAILVDRLRGFQSGKFACRENALALTHLEDAGHWLAHRTAMRLRRGVEGTHTV